MGGTLRIWVASDHEIHTCRIAPAHVALMFPRGSESLHTNDGSAFEAKLQRISQLATGLEALEGAVEPTYMIPSEVLREALDARDRRAGGPLGVLFEPELNGKPVALPEWMLRLTDLARLAADQRSGLVISESPDF